MRIRLYQFANKTKPDGTAPIYYCLAKGSKRRYILSEISLQPKHFDNASSTVLRGAQNSTKLNAFFKIQLARLHDIVIDLINAGHEPTFERVQAKFNNNTGNDFITFALDELAKEKGTIEFKTYEGYKNRLENLRKFKHDIPFNEINHNFLTTLRQHFIRNGRKPNGYYQDFAVIKKFYRLAVIKGHAKGNPFEHFTMEKEETIKAWLTRQELLKLEELLSGKKITEAEKNTLRHFLFSCYSGIRFGDKQAFSGGNIIDGRIQLRQRKTNNHVTIPFIGKAEQLVPYVLNRSLKQSNSRVNTDLENVMKVAGINKEITYHCSRHTFAINCILAGIDIITVRDWLGHKSVTTTEIYAKIAASYKDKSALKLDSFLNDAELEENRNESKQISIELPEETMSKGALIEEVKKLKEKGLTNVAIAEMYNVSETAVRKWLKK